MLAATNCITIDGFLQHNRRRSEKLRSRGGFQAALSPYHMNRHNNKRAGKNQNRKQTTKTNAN
jgi:hypothetical protein